MLRLTIVASAAIGLLLLVAFVAARVARSRHSGVSIRLQVFFALGSIVGAFALGLGIMVIDRIESRAVRFATQAATDEAHAVAHILSQEIRFGQTDLSQIAARLRKHTGSQGIELFDVQGKRLFPAAVPEAHKPDASVSAEARIQGADALVGTVRVVKPALMLRRMLEDFAPIVLVITLVLGAAAALAAAWIGRAIAAPIEALSRFAEDVKNGVPVSPPTVGGREVTQLTESIDSMRKTLEGRAFVETFAADLSHELKNPVAAIRASAEVLDEGALEEPQEARRFVARIREATARIERLLSELLSLAHIEARGVVDFEPIDIADLAQTVCANIQSDRGSLERNGDTHVRGDSNWLSRALANLLDNALIHSTGAIQVSVVRENESVTVTVSCPGAIRGHVREQLFRRFVTTRADKGGPGLGLAIVRAVAESHRGQAELWEDGPPTVRFRLTLPAAHTA